MTSGESDHWSISGALATIWPDRPACFYCPCPPFIQLTRFFPSPWIPAGKEGIWDLPLASGGGMCCRVFLLVLMSSQYSAVLRELRQQDHKFKTSLDCIVRPCLNNAKRKSGGLFSWSLLTTHKHCSFHSLFNIFLYTVSCWIYKINPMR